ncbi:hypothetical protein BSZ37_19275 [Rubrivirga marina]|uniref:PrcB C-terminal domain-containing protein n=2 Tax=Rubrivirga marina TaxID=1196024 RepID=A0A271J4G0_9BACT|nr:hypothetical protein BSZ37_19275 [Rubrivirga marina]
MPNVVLLLAALAFAGCDVFESSEPVAFTRIALPARPVLVNGTTVVRGDYQLSAFTRSVNDSLISVPTIDFDRQTVLGVFYGGSFHAGCRGNVETIEGIRLAGDALIVEVGPLPDLGPCRAIVYPSDMVVVNARATSVRFVGAVPQ